MKTFCLKVLIDKAAGRLDWAADENSGDIVGNVGKAISLPSPDEEFVTSSAYIKSFQLWAKFLFSECSFS